MIFFFCVFLQYIDEDMKVAGKYKGNDYSQYSPWSCETIGSYIGTKDAKPKDTAAVGLVEMGVSMQRRPNDRCQRVLFKLDLVPEGQIIISWF